MNLRPHINWSEDPSHRPKTAPIRHAPASGQSEFLLLSEVELGLFGHWNRHLKRNVPCTDPHGCICQEEAIPTWWRCYIGAREPQGRIVLVEVTAHAWLLCGGVAWRTQRGTLRGSLITLKRSPQTKEGKVVARLHEPPGQLDLTTLPSAPDVKAELQRIWYSRL